MIHRLMEYFSQQNAYLPGRGTNAKYFQPIYALSLLLSFEFKVDHISTGKTHLTEKLEQIPIAPID